MANHSRFSVTRTVTPETVEWHFASINDRLFKGRLELTTTEELTQAWQSGRAWILEAPGTRPKEPGPWDPDENLGFCFWLHKNGKTIEFRHVVFNSWIRWVQDRFKHELAQELGVKTLNDDGVGDIPVNPKQYRDTFYNYATRNFKKPLQPLDLEAVQSLMLRFQPEGW